MSRGPGSLRRGVRRPSAAALLLLLGLVSAPAALAAVADSASARVPDARDGSGFTRHVDVRPAAGHPDQLGLDFDLRYEKGRDDPADPRQAYALLAVAKGFQTFDRSVPDANSMTGEISLQGHYFAADLTPLSDAEKRRHAELSDKSPLADPPGPGLTPAEQAEFDALDRELFGHRPTLWTYDLHYRIETNHDVSKAQNVFGAGGAGEVPLLHGLLDLVPALVRGPAYWRPQPVRAYLAAEYVAPRQDDVFAFASGRVDRLWRVRLESAWRTRVSTDVDLRAESRVDWLPDPPRIVRDAGRGVNAFVQAWLLYPLRSGSRAAVMITYFDGRLAPGYTPVSGGKVGLSVRFSAE